MTTILLRDLLPGQDYSIQLRTNTGDNVSEWSRLFDISTPADPTPPTAPEWAVLNPWVSDSDSFVANWQPIDTGLPQNADFSHYEVEMVGNSITKTVRTNNTTFVLSFDLNRTFFDIDETITARVRAVDLTGNASAWTSTLSATNPEPGNVQNASAVGGSGTIDIKWDAPSGPTDDDIIGYAIYVGATKVWSGSATRYLYPTVIYTSQTFVIKAVDKFNQESAGVSKTATASNPFYIDTTPPPDPEWNDWDLQYSTDGSVFTYYLNWYLTGTPPDDFAGYQIRYREHGTGLAWQDLGTFGADADTAQGVLPISATGYDFEIRAFDTSLNYTNFDSTEIFAGPPTSLPPSKPSAPTVNSNTQRIQVVIPGTKDAGGAMEGYVKYYEVYAGTTSPLATSTATLLGVIPVGPAMVGSWQLPTSGSSATQNWFVKIRAISLDGQASPNSNQVTATPGLIAGVNIQDATITNAKIADLSVDKLTAGDITAASVGIKTTLTMGSASTNGYIQSYDWASSGGTSGYQITKNSINIKNGTIAASAITLTSAFANSVVGSTTTIDGGKINTGQIQSNAPSTIDGDPLWYINFAGAAVFENMTVRGTSVVGKSGDGAASLLASYGFNPANPTGWAVYGDGTANFRSVTVRGAITATSGSFTGNVDVTGSGKLRALGSGAAKIEFNSAELAAYNSVGVKMTSIDAATGLLTATDAIVEGTIRTGLPSGSPNTTNYIQVGDYGSTGFISFFTGDASEAAEGKIWSGISTAAGTGSNRTTFMTLVAPTLKNPSNVAQPEAKIILNGARQGHVAGTFDGKHGWVQLAGEMIWLDTAYGDQWGTYITGGTIIGTTGTKTGQVNWGVATTNVQGGGGQSGVTHGAGSFTPSAVFVETNSSTYEAYVVAHTVGGFTVELRNRTTGALAPNGTAVSLRYLCLFA